MRGGLLERLERRGAAAGPGSPQSPEPDNRAAPLAHEEVVRRIQAHILDSHPTLLGPAGRLGDGRRRLKAAIQNYIAADKLATGKSVRETLAEDVLNEVTGLGPIEPLMQDEAITEVMVNGPEEVWIEVDGKLRKAEEKFRDADQLVEVIMRAVAPLGRRIDQSSPFADGRLPDGSRLHACIPPVSLKGPVLCIRKFPRKGFTLGDLVRFGTLTEEAREFLEDSVRNRLNILIAGGTGSGKTSTLNALLGALGEKNERVVTIEDCAELFPPVANIVALESRPANIEGRGEVTIRTLVRNALRMRPDRLVVGEVRGAEAFDMLQAMNTGHQGSMSTVHANGPEEALKRVEGMALMAPEVPERVVQELVFAAIDVVIFQKRLPTGDRRITSISLMVKDASPGSLRLLEVFSSTPGRAGLPRCATALPSWYWARAGKTHDTCP
ncbi:MAG: CpaF family protein [Bacillota bacterium]|nr:CpaF family protein [Bacillota bacterium]